MAYLQRYLIAPTFLLLALCLCPPCASSQTEPPKPVMFRTLAVGNTAAVAGLRYADKGRTISLPAGSNSLSQPYPAPRSGHLVLFRELPPAAPGEPFRRIPVTEARLDADGPCLLVLTSFPDPADPGARKVTAIPVDDSWQVHPAETVRVFNFSRRNAALKIGPDTVELSPAQSHIARYPENSRVIDLKIAISDHGEWKLCSCSPQGIIPKTRMIVVITDEEPTPSNPFTREAEVNIIYDTAPPPEPRK
jgi:hypothetical protein